MKKCLILASSTLLAVSSVSAASLFSDSFDYPDGSLTAVSGGIWANHSGTAGQMDVQSGVVNLTESESEDANALLAGGPYATGMLYYSMLVNFSALPFGDVGGYFAHFKDSGTGFRARLFATTTDAAPGNLRLGIANGQNTISAYFPSDLVLNQTYQAVVRYDSATALTTLWLNPTLETDLSVTAADAVTALTIESIALRQSKTSTVGMGTLMVDDLRVATSFDEVVSIVPEPTSAVLVAFGGLAGLFHLRRKWGAK